MEIKIFGKSLFSVNRSNNILSIVESSDKKSKSKFLPDFYQEGDASEPYIRIEELSEKIDYTHEKINKLTKKKKEKGVKKSEPEPTPKDVYQLKLLNDETFELKTEPEYVDEQIKTFVDKLSIIKSEEWDVRNGVEEISSILKRFENRKKYGEFDEFYSEFPYTTTSRIESVIETHGHLKVGKVAQFIADMPKEAVDVMKSYNKNTERLCDKQAVFYIIADKKDFKKTNSRRDPILLAQSPFGHFWQILGAWDEEMLFLEEL